MESPPPLTPPHKGEGDLGQELPGARIEADSGAAPEGSRETRQLPSPLWGGIEGAGSLRPRRHTGRRLRLAASAVLALLQFAPAAFADPPGRQKRPVTVGRICHLIEVHADRHGLPRDFFARLIWKESRFDPDAVSPAGAEGIAQFMPGTAELRGLVDPFDVESAIPASATAC